MIQFALDFYGETMVNPSAEWLVWRLYGDSVKRDTFYGDFTVKLVWRLSKVFIEKKHGKTNYQTISILILP